MLQAHCQCITRDSCSHIHRPVRQQQGIESGENSHEELGSALWLLH